MAVLLGEHVNCVCKNRATSEWLALTQKKGGTQLAATKTFQIEFSVR